VHRDLQLGVVAARGEQAIRLREVPHVRVLSVNRGSSSLTFRLSETPAGSSGPEEQLTWGAVAGEGTRQFSFHRPVLDQRQEA
jgi:hypothetical protein